MKRWTSASSLVVLVVALGAVGCGGSAVESPEDVLTAWVAAMNASRTDPASRRRAFDLLATPARTALTERAARAIQLSGRELPPWEMLAPGRFALRFAFDRSQLHAQITGDRAVVRVQAAQGNHAEVPMVREQGQWRVDLPLPAMPALPPSSTTLRAAPRTPEPVRPR